MEQLGYRTNRIRIAVKVIVFTLAFLLLFMLTSTSINAGWFWEDADTGKVVTFLQNHSKWLQKSENEIQPALRTVAWMVVTVLYKLTSLFEGIMNQAVSLLSWTESSGLTTLMDGLIGKALNGLVWILLTISVILVAIKIIVQKEQPNFKGYVANFMISVILIVGMPQLMGTLNTMATAFFTDALTAGEAAYTKETSGDNSSETANLSWSVVSQNIADLVYVGRNGFNLIENDASTIVKKHAFTNDSFFSLDLSSVLTGKAIDEAEVNNSEFEYLRYAISDDGMGNATAYKMDTWSFSSLITGSSSSAGYFRYPLNFWTIFLTLLALCVAYVFTAFCMAKTVFEIGIKEIYGVMVFATDIETGERTKMVIKDILMSYAGLVFYAINYQIFFIFLAYLVIKSDIGEMLHIIAYIAATCAMIGGSTTVMKYFGIQLGFSQQARNLTSIAQTISTLKFQLQRLGGGNGGGNNGGGGGGGNDGPDGGSNGTGGSGGGGGDSGTGGVKKSVDGKSDGRTSGSNGNVIDMNTAAGQKMSFSNSSSAADKEPNHNAENSTYGNNTGQSQTDSQNGNSSGNTGSSIDSQNNGSNKKHVDGNTSADSNTGANRDKKAVGSNGTAENTSGMSYSNNRNVGQQTGDVSNTANEGLTGNEKKTVDAKKTDNDQVMPPVSNSPSGKTDAAQNGQRSKTNLLNAEPSSVNKGVGMVGEHNKSGNICSTQGDSGKSHVNRDSGSGVANTFAQSGEVSNSAQSPHHVGDRGSGSGGEYASPPVSNSGAEHVSPADGTAAGSVSAPPETNYSKVGGNGVSDSSMSGAVKHSDGAGNTSASVSSAPANNGSYSRQSPINPNDQATTFGYDRMGLYDGLDSITYKSENSTNYREAEKGDGN